MITVYAKLILTNQPVSLLDGATDLSPIQPNINVLKQLGRFASLNHNNNITAEPSHVEVNHSAHACGPTICTQLIMMTIYFKLYKYMF